MWGRFVQKSSASDIEFSFRTTNPLPNIRVRYNAAPGQELAAVRKNPKTDERSLDLLTWGLVPHWAKDRKIGWKTINARSETLAATNLFREALLNRRCLVPADAFYEWTGEKGRRWPEPTGRGKARPASLPRRSPAIRHERMGRRSGDPVPGGTGGVSAYLRERQYLGK
jgi:putative SOS response-associated peptidase YedK